MIEAFLGKHSKVMHLHDRFPPSELTNLEIKPPKNDYSFSSEKVNPRDYLVVFIFRYPWEALISRHGKQHCINIDADYENVPENKCDE